MTKQPNEKNERIKKQFLEYRKFARQMSEKTLDRELAALERFDVWNNRDNFAQFHIKQAMEFRTHLEQTKKCDGQAAGQVHHAGHSGHTARVRRLAFSAGGLS